MFKNIDDNANEHYIESIKSEIDDLVQKFGPNGVCYEDSRVVDMLANNSGATNVQLLKLLHNCDRDFAEYQRMNDPNAYTVCTFVFTRND